MHVPIYDGGSWLRDRPASKMYAVVGWWKRDVFRCCSSERGRGWRFRASIFHRTHLLHTSRTPVLLVLTLENRESQTHHLCKHSTPTCRYILQETLSLSSHTGLLRSSGAASFVTTVAFTIRFFAFQISEQVGTPYTKRHSRLQHTKPQPSTKPHQRKGPNQRASVTCLSRPELELRRIFGSW
jgi:hypothetical protein